MLDHQHPELQNAEYIVFVDSARRYVDCTASVCDLLGYTRSEMLWKSIDDISYESKVCELFELYLTQRELQGEYVLQRKDRAPVPIYYKSFVFEDECKAAIWEPIKDWREPYLAALFEPDSHKQIEKIEQALRAIDQCRNDHVAMQKANDAILVLNALRKR